MLHSCTLSSFTIKKNANTWHNNRAERSKERPWIFHIWQADTKLWVGIRRILETCPNVRPHWPSVPSIASASQIFLAQRISFHLKSRQCYTWLHPIQFYRQPNQSRNRFFGRIEFAFLGCQDVWNPECVIVLDSLAAHDWTRHLQWRKLFLT